MKTKTKKAISLIVLVITIIVLAILAATVILTITNTGLINSAKDAINKAELKQVEKIANLAWSEAYVDGKRSQSELEDYVLDMLEKNNINIGKYVITVTTEGVTVKFDDSNNDVTIPTVAGLYETGTQYGTLITSWDELVASGAIVVNNGVLSTGVVLPEGFPEKNEYGFYYDVLYDFEGFGFVFKEDTSFDVYRDGALIEAVPAGVITYSLNSIDMSVFAMGVGIVSADGKSITFGDTFGLVESEESLSGKNEYGFYYDVLYDIDGFGYVFKEDTSFDMYKDGALIDAGPTGEITYSLNSIDMSAFDMGVGIVSADGKSITFGDTFIVAGGQPAEFPGDLVLPNDGSITALAADAFNNRTTLTSIVIPDSVTSFASGGESGGPAPMLLDAESEVTITGTFNGCSSLQAVNFGANSQLTTIGGYAFYGCTSLTSVVLPDTVTTIEYNAFVGCANMASIKVPASIEYISYETFSNCTNLKTVYYEGTLEEWCNISYSGGHGNPCANGAALYISGELVDDIEIPASVVTIGSGAFEGCTSLTSVQLHAGVTTSDYRAFCNCTNLKTVYYEGTLEGWCNISFSVDSGNPCANGAALYISGELVDDIEIPAGVATIGDRAFEGCVSVKSVKLPVGLTTIGVSAFSQCPNLIEIDISSSVTSIENWAFYNCMSLKSVKIPVSVTSIAANTFRGCTSLTTINYGGTTTQWTDGTITFGYYWNQSTGEYTVYCTDGTISKTGVVSPAS